MGTFIRRNHQKPQIRSGHRKIRRSADRVRRDGEQFGLVMSDMLDLVAQESSRPKHKKRHRKKE